MSENFFQRDKYLKYIWTFLKWPFVCKNWWIGFLAYIEHFNDPKRLITYYMRNGLKLRAQFNSTDFQIVREVFVHDNYLQYIPQKFEPKIILDAGAHKGYVAIPFAQRYPKSRVICLEPDITNFRLLKQNISINKIRNIEVIKSALGKKNGIVNFYLTTDSVNHSLVPLLPDRIKKTTKVKCQNIKSIMRQYDFNKIDIFKIDIEGGEYDIFFNLDEEIISKIRCFIIEAHTTKDYSIKNLYKFFSAKKYSIYRPYEFENVIVVTNNAIR